MKIKFSDFTNESYKLTIEDSMDDFEIAEAKWLLTYDIDEIWNKYINDKNLNLFVENYKNVLLSKKDELIKINKNSWIDLQKLIKEKNKDNVLPYLDRIYDWADKYGIKISVKNKNKN